MPNSPRDALTSVRLVTDDERERVCRPGDFGVGTVVRALHIEVPVLNAHAPTAAHAALNPGGEHTAVVQCGVCWGC